MKVLQFVVSRKKELRPIIVPKSRFGYLYPLITVNFVERDDIRMFDVLKFIEENKLMDSRFVDRIHLCPDCLSAFLNYREICPKCSSANLKEDDLVHHFPCGYVGPENEFKIDDKLICPKCGKVLRHIGMDYDKPSVIFKCNDCGHSFQEPEISVLCMSCKEKIPVEELIREDINIFTASQITVNSAIEGLVLSVRDILSRSMNLYDNRAFMSILEHEKRRQKRSKNKSTLMYLRFDISSQVKLTIDVQKEINYEIAKKIKEILRESDPITPLNDNYFAILLIDSSDIKFDKVVDRLKTDLKKFLEEKFSEVEAELKIEYLSLNDDTYLRDTETKVI